MGYLVTNSVNHKLLGGAELVDAVRVRLRSFAATPFISLISRSRSAASFFSFAFFCSS